MLPIFRHNQVQDSSTCLRYSDLDTLLPGTLADTCPVKHDNDMLFHNLLPRIRSGSLLSRTWIPVSISVRDSRSESKRRHPLNRTVHIQSNLHNPLGERKNCRVIQCNLNCSTPVMVENDFGLRRSSGLYRCRIWRFYCTLFIDDTMSLDSWSCAAVYVVVHDPGLPWEWDFNSHSHPIPTGFLWEFPQNLTETHSKSNRSPHVGIPIGLK